MSDVKQLIKFIDSQEPRIKHNEDILCILEGDLLRFIVEHFKMEFKEADSVHQVFTRIAPINFLRRIVDKLSSIYMESPKRVVIDGTEQDQEILDWYVDHMEMDAVMNVANEFFNAFKYNLNQVYLLDGKPKLRAIPNDYFLVYSDNKVDPTQPTHVILPYGKRMVKTDNNKEREIDQFVVWTKQEVFIMDVEGNVMPYLDSGEFENPFDGAWPFMYVNRSRNFLIPPIDSDTKRMSILLPALISDLSYAVKFQSFSIIYGINLNDENIVMKPNGFWTFKSDPGSDQSPSLGQLKPQVDIQQVVEFITTQLVMWLNSKNIRPGAVSDMAAETMASGISKVVDEMDTTEERKKQVEFYKVAEERFWDDLIHKIHPVWVQQGLIDETRLFSSNAKVNVTFPEQLPQLRRGEMVSALTSEVDAGFLSRRTAMLKLNPHWGEAELEEELMKISEDEGLGFGEESDNTNSSDTENVQ